jgi:hypothetical protein
MAWAIDEMDDNDPQTGQAGREWLRRAPLWA